MSASKFSTPYQKVTKENGQPLDASDWNAISEAVENVQTKINEVIDDIDNIPSGSGGGSSSGGGTTPTGVISVSSKGNTTLSSTKHINIEPGYVPDGGSGTYGDVQVKPGDDITLESHHRASDKRDEITIKTSDGVDGSKAPVKLQVIASNMTFSTKGKVVPQGSNDSPEVMNINATTGNGKAYLKVRARAIDLRCEEHGGIALQPMGSDGQGHQNKVKFEHGGGDGKEFFTMNAEKMSAFVDEYRFKKEGVWKMAKRTLLDNTSGAGGNDKYDPQSSDETQHYSYQKQEDDFYDQFEQDDETCTTRDIIQTAAALNGHPCIHAKVTNKGNLEIATTDKYLAVEDVTAGTSINADLVSADNVPLIGSYYSLTEVLAFIDAEYKTAVNTALAAAAGNAIIAINFHVTENDIETILLQKFAAPDIKIESGAGLKLGGILDFGSSFNFGETDNGIEVQYKLTKKNATKDCGVLKVVGVNNHATNNLVVGDTTVAPGQTAVIAQCSILDIIKAVNWMKDNNEGPWGNA